MDKKLLKLLLESSQREFKIYDDENKAHINIDKFIKECKNSEFLANLKPFGEKEIFIHFLNGTGNSGLGGNKVFNIKLDKLISTIKERKITNSRELCKNLTDLEHKETLDKIESLIFKIDNDIIYYEKNEKNFTNEAKIRIPEQIIKETLGLKNEINRHYLPIEIFKNQKGLENISKFYHSNKGRGGNERIWKYERDCDFKARFS